jgi:hypothetical protein
MSAASKPRRSRGPVGQEIFAKVLGFFCCVGLPLFISAIAPISVVRLGWQNERVTAEITNRVFYLIPYRRVVLDGVQSVDDRFHEGELIRDRDRDSSTGRRREHRAEDESFLVLHGPDRAEEVSVSPINIRSTVEKAQAFLAQPNSGGLRLTVVANWKFGVIIPILLSPLLLLYLAGLVLVIWRLVRPRTSKPAQ